MKHTLNPIQKSVKWNLNMENLTKTPYWLSAMRRLVQGKLSASEAELELRKEVAKEEKLAQPTSTKTELKGKKNKFNVTDHYPTAIK
jgi:hypothetical protein